MFVYCIFIPIFYFFKIVEETIQKSDNKLIDQPVKVKEDQQEVDIKKEKKILNKEKFITMITIANSCMGASYLTLAYQFKRLGWLIGILFIVFAACWTYMGFHFTIKATDAIRIGSLKKILELMYGKVFGIIIDIAVTLEYVSYLTCYVNVTSSYFRLAIINIAKFDIPPLYVKIGFGVVFAILTCIKTLTCFSRIASFSMLFIIATTISVIVCAIIAKTNGYFTINMYDEKTQENNIIENYPIPSYLSLIGPERTNNNFYVFLECIMRLPIFQTLYGVYASISAIYKDMSISNDKKSKVLHASSLLGDILATIIYLLNPIFSNMIFGRDVASNVLLSFSPQFILFTIMRLLSCFSLSVSYILVLYPIRTIILSWLPWKEGKKYNAAFYLTGFIIVIITVIIAVLVSNIDTILNFISSIIGLFWYAILPVMMAFASPKINAAKYDRKIKELTEQENKTDDSKNEEIQQKDQILPQRRESIIDRIGRRSSVTYDLPTVQDEKLDDMKQNLTRKESIKQVQSARLSLSQAENQIQQNIEVATETVDQNEKEKQEQQSMVVNILPSVSQENTSVIPSKVENIDLMKKQLELLEKKDKELAKMNWKRYTLMGAIILVIVAIHITSFVLSTFFDMTKDQPFQKQ